MTAGLFDAVCCAACRTGLVIAPKAGLAGRTYYCPICGWTIASESPRALGRAWCFTCSTSDRIFELQGRHGLIYQCRSCGPVVPCAARADAPQAMPGFARLGSARVETFAGEIWEAPEWVAVPDDGQALTSRDDTATARPATE